MTLPKPTVHFDTLHQHAEVHLKDLLRLPAEQKLEIIHDPTGESGGVRAWAQTYSTTYTMLRLVFMYERSHQQVVVVGPRMQAAFANTSLENIPTDLIKLPHECFYLAVPECELELWGGERTGWHKVTGCYVAKEPTANALVLLAWGAANERSNNALDDATFWFRLDLDRLPTGDNPNLEHEVEALTEKRVLDHVFDNIEAESRAVGRLCKARGKHANLDDALDNLLDHKENEASDLTTGLYRHGANPAHVKRVKDSARKLMRIVVNTVLYINSASSEVSDPVTSDNERAQIRARLKGVKSTRKGTGKVLQKRLDALPAHRMVWVGPTIEQEVGGERDFTLTGRRGVSGHIRRGHWHQFRVGPMKLAGTLIPKVDRALTIKWMPPLWVGSVREATGARLYGVREPEQS